MKNIQWKFSFIIYNLALSNSKKLLLSFIIYNLALSNSFAASWRTFRYNAFRSGNIQEQAYPYSTPPSGWSFKVQVKILSSPIIKDGIVYFGAQDTSIWALDAYTGEILWQYSTSGFVDSTPCYWNNFVYVLSRDGNLYCFKAKYSEDEDPQPLWQYNTGTKSCSSPVVVNGKVIFVTGPTQTGIPEGYLYIIDATSGSLIKKQRISQFSHSAPAVDSQGRIYLCTNDGNIHCYDYSGNLNWSVSTQGSLYFTAVSIKDDRIYGYAGDLDRMIYAIDRNSGNVLWKSTQLSYIATDATSIGISENKLIVNVYPTATFQEGTRKSSGTVFCINSQDGSILWRKDYRMDFQPAESFGFTSSPAIANDIIYVGTYDGNLYVLDILTGNTIAQYQLNGQIIASPAVSNGWIYFGTTKGIFYGIEAEKIASITQPDNDDTVVLQTVIKGTVKNPTPNYTVEYGQGSSPTSWTQIASSNTEITNSTITVLDVSNLSDGTYTLRLTVNNDQKSRAINIFTVDNPPKPPTNLTAFDTPFDGSGSITLEWTKSVDDGSGDNDVQGYKIYRSTYNDGFVQISTVNAGITSYIDRNLPNELTFYYVLKSFDTLNESQNFSNVASAMAIVDGVKVLPNEEKTVQLPLTDGTTVEIFIEAYSVSEEVYVGIRIPQKTYDEAIPKFAQKTKQNSRVYEFGGTKTTGEKFDKFLKPVIIKIPYLPQDIVGMSKENLRIFWLDESKTPSQWRIVNTSQVREDEERVWAKVPHFAIFRLMEYVAGVEELLEKDKVYTYPNPALGDKLYFKFKLGDKADVIVDVYNVAGELIKHLEEKDKPAGIVSEIEWDISQIASGVYIYRLEARSANKTKAVKKKLAIVH